MVFLILSQTSLAKRINFSLIMQTFSARFLSNINFNILYRNTECASLPCTYICISRIYYVQYVRIWLSRCFRLKCERPLYVKLRSLSCFVTSSAILILILLQNNAEIVLFYRLFISGIYLVEYRANLDYISNFNELFRFRVLNKYN